MPIMEFRGFDLAKPIPLPPAHQQKLALHHWLEEVDFDGRAGEVVVLQWAPGARNWCQSGYVGTNKYVHTAGWRYVGQAIMPGSIDLEDLPVQIRGQSELFDVKKINDAVKVAFMKGLQGKYAFYPETVEGLINCIKRLIGKE